ncbi:MAG: hypothetical protein ACOX46_03505 [Limnochordia bacterium]
MEPIIYQYLDMVGDLTSATVGIEDATGTDGLQVVYKRRLHRKRTGCSLLHLWVPSCG